MRDEATARAVMVLARETRKSAEAAERADLVAQALAKRYGVTRLVDSAHTPEQVPGICL